MSSPIFIDNPLKRVQIECLIAFCHTRITGYMGKDQLNTGKDIFKNRFVCKDSVAMAKDLEKHLEEIATIETINKKISSGNVALSNMYHHHYMKLVNLLDDCIPADTAMIEGLIGVYILKLATEKGMLNFDTKEESLNYYNYLINFYRSDKYLVDDDTLKVVNFMEEVSNKIFNKYWEQPKRKSKKRK